MMSPNHEEKDNLKNTYLDIFREVKLAPITMMIPLEMLAAPFIRINELVFKGVRMRKGQKNAG